MTLQTNERLEKQKGFQRMARGWAGAALLVLGALCWQVTPAHGQTPRGPAGGFVRPAPSAWPVYQAARSQGVPLYPPVTYGQAYPRVQSGLDNPWYSAPYQ